MMTATDKKQCFVVGPIGAAGTDIRVHSDWLLHEIIEKVMAEYPDFKTVRADKISNPGMIDSQIITSLLDADLVIADMTTLNANAFYEMGIRHMAQKPTIHMFLEGTEIPFDVKPYRAISFSLRHPSDLATARAELSKALVEALAEGHVVENPVTRARGKVELREHATPVMQVIIDQVESLTSSVRILSSRQEKASLRGQNLLMQGPAAAIVRFSKEVSEFDVDMVDKIANEAYGVVARAPGSQNFFISFSPNITDERYASFEANIMALTDASIVQKANK